jgi:hypothetical protein
MNNPYIFFFFPPFPLFYLQIAPLVSLTPPFYPFFSDDYTYIYIPFIKACIRINILILHILCCLDNNNTIIIIYFLFPFYNNQKKVVIKVLIREKRKQLCLSVVYLLNPFIFFFIILSNLY